MLEEWMQTESSLMPYYFDKKLGIFLVEFWGKILQSFKNFVLSDNITFRKSSRYLGFFELLVD